MSPYPALAGLRIGCVKYLNSRPLIVDYPGPVCFDHPAALARGMATGALDAALVPVFEALGGRGYRLVDGVAIACRGPVYSVFLAYEGELAAIRSVALDPASLTSVHLLKVLLQEGHRLTPSYVPFAEEADARLLIGNQAIEYRRTAGPEVRFLDLGEEWWRQTGLPFVFALWLLRLEVPEPALVARDFRRLKCEGLRRLPEIVAAEREYGPELATRYLTEHIRFDLGAEEKRGLELFRRLARKHGFLPGELPLLEFC